MRISIIVPVLNEEAILENYLAPLAGQCAQHNCELLIVDGGSTDNTVAIAQRYGQVIHSTRGRATQMECRRSHRQGRRTALRFMPTLISPLKLLAPSHKLWLHPASLAAPFASALTVTSGRII